MKIDPADLPFDLVEADIVEALKACTRDCANPVIGYQEMFLPAHEYVLPFGDVAHRRRAFLDLLSVRVKCTEPFPMLQICFAICAPAFVVGEKIIFGPDDLAFKICGEGGMVLSEACIKMSKDKSSESLS